VVRLANPLSMPQSKQYYQRQRGDLRYNPSTPLASSTPPKIEALLEALSKLCLRLYSKLYLRLCSKLCLKPYQSSAQSPIEALLKALSKLCLKPYRSSTQSSARSSIKALLKALSNRLMLNILGFKTIQYKPPELVGIRFIRAVYN